VVGSRRLGLSWAQRRDATLCERYELGFAGGELELVDAGVDTVISASYPAQVGGPEWPKETATVIRFRNGLVVHMQQYRTRDQVLRSLA
jgi:hypothetical protein